MQIRSATALLALGLAGVTACGSFSAKATFHDAGESAPEDAGTAPPDNSGSTPPPTSGSNPGPTTMAPAPPGPPGAGGATTLLGVRIRLDETVALPTGDAELTATLLGLTTATSTGSGGAHLDTQLCGFSTAGDAGSATAPAAATATGTVAHLESYARFGMVAPGASLQVSTMVLPIGWRSTQPATEALPQAADDPRVVDSDGDGKPGYTVQVMNPPNAEVYIVARFKAALTGTFQDANHASGTTAGALELSVVGSNSRRVQPATLAVKQTTTASLNDFQMIAVSQGANCATITATAGASIFH